MSSESPEIVNKQQAAAAPKSGSDTMKNVVALMGLITIVLLASTIGLAVDRSKTSSAEVTSTANTSATTKEIFSTTKSALAGTNICNGKKVTLESVDCIVNQITKAGDQSGTNVTEGYQGQRNSTAVPLTQPFWKAGLCPVNVHWHLGTEHLSVGEYDETGTGPSDVNKFRSLSERQGFQCKYYDASDAKFTKPYDWQFCKNMEVGQTYEVHWPSSALGDCGTPNQYQTPFYDGVFCHSDLLDAQNISSQIGVQAQVFTIVNDESYYYPDLIRGMIVDGEMGTAVTKYTGSTTGTKVNNELCSGYTPISWQVDRKCHMISASSFDKLCADMLTQRDDMSDDVMPHGSRELVSDALAANNHQNLRFLRSI